MNLIQFWFSCEKKWFQSDRNFDQEVYDKFNHILEEKRKNYTYTNKNELLELIILFDQISRNIYRINLHCFRKEDDILAVTLVEEYIQMYKIPQSQQELYFVILPLRHTLDKKYCKMAIDLINLFEEKNITDKQKWTNFVCASYRSFYNSTSHIERNSSKISIDDFKKTYTKYKDIIDPKISSLENLNQNFTDNIIFNELLKDIPINCKNLCVSLSGGVDSMVIIHALSILKKIHNFQIFAVHIHHFNRIEASLEAEMIEEFCNILGVRYFQIDISHLKRGEINRNFYETETRRIRFDFYRNMILHHKIEYFALGHHRGDLAENVLTNLIKGRSLTDLPVMKRFDFQEDVTIWRPFIDIPKSDIWNYAELYGIIYTKNCTPEWSVRGKFRNILLPLLNDMFNSVEENLYNTGLESRELNEYVQKNVIDKVISTVYNAKFGFCFPVFFLQNTNFTIWKITLQKIFHSNGIAMLKDNSIKILMKMEKGIYKLCKDFLIYFDGCKMIFIKEDLFKRKINYEITDPNVNDTFKIEDLLDGIVTYNIYYTDEFNFTEGKLPKNMKKLFNNILPSEILNKLNWIINDFPYYQRELKSYNKKGIKIEF